MAIISDVMAKGAGKEVKHNPTEVNMRNMSISFQNSFEPRNGACGACTGCTGCSGCSACSGCTGCTGCSGCSACSAGTGRYETKNVPMASEKELLKSLKERKEEVKTAVTVA